MRNDILFKAKAIEEGMGWLTGSIMITDNNRNNPFPTAPIRKHYQIMHYCAGDWNMGGLGVI